MFDIMGVQLNGVLLSQEVAVSFQVYCRERYLMAANQVVIS